MSSSTSCWSLLRKLDPAPAFENNRFRVQELLVFAQLPDEFLDAELIEDTARASADPRARR